MTAQSRDRGIRIMLSPEAARQSGRMTPLARARWLVARECAVMPIPAPVPGVVTGPGDGETPAIGWHAYQRRRPTDAELVTWFPPGVPVNVGIVTGAISGIVVVALAGPPARVWWSGRRFAAPAWQIETGRGEWDLCYRHPGGVIRTQQLRLVRPDGTPLVIDVHGEASYVLAPGSVHADGTTAEACGDWRVPRKSLPLFRPSWLVRYQHPLGVPVWVPRPTGEPASRARFYLQGLPVPQIGQEAAKHVAAAAYHLVHEFTLPETDAARLLWEWCGNRDGWTFDWITQKVIAAGRQHQDEPVGGQR